MGSGRLQFAALTVGLEKLHPCPAFPKLTVFTLIAYRGDTWMFFFEVREKKLKCTSA